MTNESLGLVDATAQLSFLVHGTLASRAAERDLSITQTRLLGILRGRTPTMNDLSRFLELDKSSVTGLVSRAEKRGLVERASSQTDARSTVVTLTATGRRVIRAVAAGFASDVDHLFAGLSVSERRTFSSLAGRVVVGHATELGVDLAETRAIP